MKREFTYVVGLLDLDRERATLRVLSRHYTREAAIKARPKVPSYSGHEWVAMRLASDSAGPYPKREPVTGDMLRVVGCCAPSAFFAEALRPDAKSAKPLASAHDWRRLMLNWEPIPFKGGDRDSSVGP